MKRNLEAVCMCGGAMEADSTTYHLTSYPPRIQYKCRDCGKVQYLTEDQSMRQVCKEEAMAQGGPYPRTCPICKLGKCVRKVPQKQQYDGMWLHLKSGGVYSVICEAENEADLTLLVVYKALHDNRIWARPKEQFLDGRFVKMNTAAFPPKYEPTLPTAEEVKAYREKTGAGLVEAKKTLIDASLREVFGDLMSNGTIDDKVEFLLRQFAKGLNK